MQKGYCNPFKGHLHAVGEWLSAADALTLVEELAIWILAK